jgi:hypothetical protein
MNRNLLRLSTWTFGALALASVWACHLTRQAKAIEETGADDPSAAANKVSLVYTVNNYGYTGTCG